jgi:hypothetical protein
VQQPGGIGERPAYEQVEAYPDRDLRELVAAGAGAFVSSSASGSTAVVRLATLFRLMIGMS